MNFMDMNISKDLEYVINALPSFGSRYSHLVMGYAQQFGVTPMHLKAKKLRLIIEEMKKLFDAQSFGWEKKNCPISHAGIAEALDICIKKDFSKPLANHNYLKSVMIDIANREGKDKSRTAEKDLRKREDNALAGGGRPNDCRAHSPNAPRGSFGERSLQQENKEVLPGKLSAEEMEANQRRAHQLAQGIFK